MEKYFEILSGCPLFHGMDASEYYGNRSVLTVLSPGELFAEVFSCAGLTAMPVSVIALKDCEQQEKS